MIIVHNIPGMYGYPKPYVPEQKKKTNKDKKSFKDILDRELCKNGNDKRTK